MLRTQLKFFLNKSLRATNTDISMATTEKAEPLSTEAKTSADAVATKYFSLVEVVLRFLLLASALVAVVVLVTSNQTKGLLFPLFGPFPTLVIRAAKFNHSPAFIYLVAALSVTGFYAIVSTLLSVYSLLKPGCFTKVLSHLVILDVTSMNTRYLITTLTVSSLAYKGLRTHALVIKKICVKNSGNIKCSKSEDVCVLQLLLGILASATGAASGVAYIGLKGNSHVGWMKVCNIYGKFCRHVGASIAISLFGSIILVLLVLLSVYS